MSCLILRLLYFFKLLWLVVAGRSEKFACTASGGNGASFRVSRNKSKSYQDEIRCAIASLGKLAKCGLEESNRSDGGGTFVLATL